MAQSLQQTVQDNQPQGTISHVQARMQGAQGEKWAFVIVEGDDDKSFYEQIFDSSHVAVYESRKEDGKTGGCSYLEKVVGYFVSKSPNSYIFGIRDADNWGFFPRRFFYRKHSKSIYRTDFRDMEMTVLADSHVRNTIQTKSYANFEICLSEVESILRYCGRLRLWNEVFHLGCNFRKAKLINKVLNQTMIVPDWKLKINQSFQRMIILKIEENLPYKNQKWLLMGVWKVIKLLDGCFAPILGRLDFYEVCQGHDALKMLRLRLDAGLDKDTFWNRMLGCYDLSHFKNGKLYKEILLWKVQSHFQFSIFAI